jgi:hypothetical protein
MKLKVVSIVIILLVIVITVFVYYYLSYKELDWHMSTEKPIDPITYSIGYENASSNCNSLCSKYEADCSDVQAAASFCLQKVNIDIDGNGVTGEKGHYNYVGGIPICEDGLYCFHIKYCSCGSLNLDSGNCLRILCDYYQNVHGLGSVQSMEAIRNGISYGSCEPNILLWDKMGYKPIKLPQSYHSDWTDKEITYLGPDYWWAKAGYNNSTC